MQLLSPVNHPCFHLSVSFQQLLNGNGQLEFCKFLLEIVMKDISNENQWSFVFSVKVCVTRLLSKSSKYNQESPKRAAFLILQSVLFQKVSVQCKKAQVTTYQAFLLELSIVFDLKFRTGTWKYCISSSKWFENGSSFKLAKTAA